MCWKSFYTKILNLALDVNKKIKKGNITFLGAVYGNENFQDLIEPDREDVFNNNGNSQNIFMTNFRGILFDFHRELSWSFECNFYLNYNNFIL